MAIQPRQFLSSKARGGGQKTQPDHSHRDKPSLRSTSIAALRSLDAGRRPEGGRGEEGRGGEGGGEGKGGGGGEDGWYRPVAERGSTDGREVVGEGQARNEGERSGRGGGRAQEVATRHRHETRTSRRTLEHGDSCYPVYFLSSMATEGRFRAARLDDQRTEEDRRAQTRCGRRQSPPTNLPLLRFGHRAPTRLRRRLHRCAARRNRRAEAQNVPLRVSLSLRPAWWRRRRFLAARLHPPQRLGAGDPQPSNPARSARGPDRYSSASCRHRSRVAIASSGVVGFRCTQAASMSSSRASVPVTTTIGRNRVLGFARSSSRTAKPSRPGIARSRITPSMCGGAAHSRPVMASYHLHPHACRNPPCARPD